MSGNLTILLYHGVTRWKSDGIENYHCKHIHADDFAEQIKFLSENCNVLSMDEVIEFYSSAKPFPQNAVAVTFDDGFENNYTVAAPILNEYGVKATFYVTSGIIDSEKMFWVDILEDAINQSETKSIDILLDTSTTFDISTDTNKISALETLKKYCKRVLVTEKDRVIANVIEQTRTSPSVSHSPNYRKITSGQLAEMSANDLFIIGGHSHDHNILSLLESKEALEKDIQLSIEKLQGIIGKPILHYAYPEGQAHHYNTAVIELLKQAGVKCCPSAIDGVNNGTEDLFHLRRIMVGLNGTPFPFSFQPTTSALHF